MTGQETAPNDVARLSGLPPEAAGYAPAALKRAVTTAASLFALIAVWHVAARVWPSRAFPSPDAVWQVLLREFANGELFFHTGATLARVAVSYFIAMIIGSAIGVFLGSFKRADSFFSPWVILFLNIPALVVIVLAYIWFGLNEAAAVGAVALNKIPNVIVTMREGTRAFDRRYSELAAVYRFGWLDRLRHVALPQLQPYLAAASRSGIALIWKIVLVVELLGRSNGVGFQIYLFFQNFEVAAILAYTLTFVAIMLIIELLVVQPFEQHAARWRSRAA